MHQMTFDHATRLSKVETIGTLSRFGMVLQEDMTDTVATGIPQHRIYYY